MSCRSVRLRAVLVIGIIGAGTTPVFGQNRGVSACAPAGKADTPAVLDSALRAMGTGTLGSKVLHFQAVDATVQDYQSDRTYAPFFLAFTSQESWYQPSTGVARYRGRVSYPDAAIDLPELLSGSSATFVVTDTSNRPAPAAHAGALVSRSLDPWQTLFDWSADKKVVVVGRCMVRDYLRVVLQRTGPYGRERLSLDPKTWLPVSLEREEPHYLWGQVSVEYVYSNWKRAAGLAVPSSAFRMVDKTADVSRTVTLSEAIPSDSTPRLTLPDTAIAMAPELPGFLRPVPPDTVRVSAAMRLLKNPGYAEGAALLGDTLYLLDATQGEERARRDSTLIAGFFPGVHPIVLVVTDLAWPHVAGVRYWVARGATVVSHRTSRAFLERVLERRWTRAPDLYERRRKTAHFKFKAVDDSVALAGGKLRLYPIDGIGSEGGLMAWLEQDRFLWAGDYIQTVQQPSTYATEVWRAVQRVGINPTRVAAEHLPLTSWSTIDSLARSDAAAESSSRSRTSS